MPSKVQTRRSVSLRGVTYARLKLYCEQRGRAVSDVLEEQIARLLRLADDSRPPPDPNLTTGVQSFSPAPPQTIKSVRMPGPTPLPPARPKTEPF